MTSISQVRHRLIVLVVCSALAMLDSAFGQIWTSNNFPGAPITFAASADGTKLVEACGDAEVYVSTNSGSSWLHIGSGLPNANVAAVSADGSVLFVSAGGLYASTNSGMSWYRITNTVQFIACSADGEKLLMAKGGAISLGSPLYTSADSGNTWVSNNAPVTNWTAATMSADGNKLAAVVYGGGIYTSTNFGSSWISNTVPSKSWFGIASSADGTKLAAVATSGEIFTSTNLGITWTTNTVPNYGWDSVASSVDGGKLIAVGSRIYSSTNFGRTWVSNSAPAANWGAVVSSADGYKLMAAVSGSRVWTSYSTPTPRLNIEPVDNNLALAWLVPSTNFVLQQSLDLSSWTDVTNPPALNLTNLQDEVIFPPTNSSGFYRLVTQ